jgi:hypothetical protein
MLRALRLFAPAVGLLIIVLGRSVPAEPEGPKPAAPTKAPQPAAGAPGPQKANVGLYLQNVPDVDVKTNSFSAEFYMWFVWSGEIDPTLNMEFTNVVNPQELTKVPVFTDASGNSVPEVLPDGNRLQQYHVYGRFGHPFPLGRYPFDSHELVISFEDSRRSADALVYEIDTKGTTMRPDLTIPGWTLKPMSTALSTKRFASNFGDPRTNRDDETYSHVDMVVPIERPVVGIVSKTIIPIALIILITFGAFFLQPADIDARLCLTITALISAVALQFTAQAELPPTGSLLLLDKIYILSYLAILVVTFLSIAANRAHHAEKLARATLIDRWGLAFTTASYFGSLIYFTASV